MWHHGKEKSFDLAGTGEVVDGLGEENAVVDIFAKTDVVEREEDDDEEYRDVVNDSVVDARWDEYDGIDV